MQNVSRGELNSEADLVAPPLDGIKVVEIGSVIMVPYAGKILRDLGADVVKMEPPEGDIGRRIGGMAPGGTGLLHLNLNAGKRSVVVDAKSSGGSGVLNDLLRWADIVLTNVLPNRRAEFGLSWDSVVAVNPDVILVTAQGFATDTDFGDLPAYDDIVQAASGVSDTYRLRDGTPQYTPYVVADKVCGMAMVNAGLAALHRRNAGGSGCWVDVPMADVMAAFNLVEHLGGATLEPPSGPVGWNRVLEPMHRPHRAIDGWMCVMPYTDADWVRFCRMIGKQELAEDSRLSTNQARTSSPSLYEQVIADYVGPRSCDTILRECAEVRVPVQQVNRVADIPNDAYFRARPFLSRSVHQAEGRYVHVGNPLVFHGSERVGAADSPILGADEDSVRADVRRAEGSFESGSC